MKVCTKCNSLLPLDNFQLNKGRLCSQCKDCRNKYFKEHYENGKRFVDSCKTKCAKCGTVDTYVLTFHHINPKTKSFEISGSRRKIDDLKKEIDKCICLCHNCHQTFHYFYGSKPDDPTQSLQEFLKEEWKPNIEVHN